MLLEDERKVQVTNFGSFYVVLNKKWADYIKLKAGNRIKMIAAGDICIIIPPNSSVYSGEALAKFREELKKW